VSLSQKVWRRANKVQARAIDPEQLTGLGKRLQIFTVVALPLTAWIRWVSLNLTRIARMPILHNPNRLFQQHVFCVTDRVATGKSHDWKE